MSEESKREKGVRNLQNERLKIRDYGYWVDGIRDSTQPLHDRKEKIIGGEYPS